MELWGRYAGVRKHMVRRSFDLYRGVERRLSPSISSPPTGFRGREPIEQVGVREPYVAMTFDDGPDPVNTPRLLDILAARGVKATFYVIGEPVTVHPDVVQRTLAEGHEVGNHTWSHRALTTQTSHSIVEELMRTQEAVEDAIGIPTASLRPPYGAVTRQMTRWIDHQFGYRAVLWSVSARDWEDPGPELITERLVSDIATGSIVLNHDPEPDTVDAMPETLDRLLDKGFRFVTVSELIALGEKDTASDQPR